MKWVSLGNTTLNLDEFCKIYFTEILNSQLNCSHHNASIAHSDERIHQYQKDCTHSIWKA